MKWRSLVAGMLILTLLLGCSLKTPVTVSPTQETPPSVAPTPEPNIPSPTVPPATLISITVEPSKPPGLNPGSKQQFKATGTYSDGTIKDISSQVPWKSSDETIAVITASGEAYGVARVSLPAATLPSDKPVAPPPGAPPGGGTRPPPPGAGSSIPLISLTADVTVTATLSGITSAPITLTVIKAPLKDLPPLDAFMKGIYFNDWATFDPSQPPPGAPRGTPLPPPNRGLYTPPQADQSLINLAHTGANWIAVSVRVGQETISSTRISRSENATATDSELRHVIDLAHSLGIRVLLMPLLHLSNDPDHWWGQIGTAFTTEAQWQEWFASYRELINSYATFAQEAGVDMLFIGNELGGTTHREADWRQVIQEIRQRYKGPITYDSLNGPFPFPHGEDVRIKWWDAVDYIGVGGYYPLTNKNDPTVDELKAAWTWDGYIDRLENLSKKFNKPLLISEIGYKSKDGANKRPAASIDAPIDLQEQADCYQAAFDVLWGKPWLKGIFWFQWFSNPKLKEQGGIDDVSATPYGKPAEEVLKKFYLSQSPAPLQATPTETRPLPPLDAFMKGMHFVDPKSYNAPNYGLYGYGTDQSLKNLAATGANWISLNVGAVQETVASTAISRDSPVTATDSELLRVVNFAHSLGMRVLLMPTVGFFNDPDHWTGEIGTAFTSETQWQEWFASYRDYINHYASFAQEAGVDMFSIGSELGGVTHREDDWRRITKEIRDRFKGPLIYDSLGWGFPVSEVKRIKWWDAVDYIATDFWFPLTDKNDPTLAELKEAWIKRGYLADLESIWRQFNRPFIISEIGYDSKDGANRWPALAWLKEGPLDLQEQADCYQAALEVLWGKPWLKGIFWWLWFANPTVGGANDKGGTPYGKPAEEVLKRFYQSQ